MINTKNISLSELLRDFNAGLNKTAGADCPPGVVCQPDTVSVVPTTPAEGEELCPECMSNPCICEGEGEEDATPEDMLQAAVAAKTKQDEAVDATKALRDMADEYIDNHDQAIAKEAAVFGELFAKSACEAMNRYNNMDQDYSMFKQACSSAYEYTLNKLAEDAESSNLSDAVRDVAAATRALAERKADPDADTEQVAQDAYDETMAQLGDAGAAGDEQTAAAQGAYNEAMAQMQQQPSAEATAQAAAQGAYNEAMAQMQQGGPQGDTQAAAAASQNAYDQAMSQLQQAQ